METTNPIVMMAILGTLTIIFSCFLGFAILFNAGQIRTKHPWFASFLMAIATMLFILGLSMYFR